MVLVVVVVVVVVVVAITAAAAAVVVALLFAAMPHVLLHDLLLFAAASLAHVTRGPMHLAVCPAHATTKVGDAVELTGARDHASATLADAAVSESYIGRIRLELESQSKMGNVSKKLGNPKIGHLNGQLESWTK